MSNETKQALDLFCEVYSMNEEQRTKIESLMRMSHLEGSIQARNEIINAK